MSLYEQLFESIREERIIISELEDEIKLYQCLEAVYRIMLEYIGLNDISVNRCLKYLLEDQILETEGKTNDEIVRDIRNDILYYLRKELNYCYFDDVDMD